MDFVRYCVIPFVSLSWKSNSQVNDPMSRKNMAYFLTSLSSSNYNYSSFGAR